MIIRLSAFYEGLSSGQFPVRFLPRLNQGVGYPVADFLYPLFLYLGSIIHLMKVPFILDIKIILILSVICSGFGMYLFLRKHFSYFSSFLGSIFYVYLPYHLYDLYTRGSVGEIVALAVGPFLFWAVERKSWIITSIFLFLVIIAHNTIAFFFFPIIILYAILRRNKLKDVVFFSLLGLGLSAFFWLPALYDRQFTHFDTTLVSNPSRYFVDAVSFHLIGWILPLIFIGALFFKHTFQDRKVVFFFLLGIVSLFFSLSISNFFWTFSTITSFVQFPFRFLSITLLSESFIAAYLIDNIHKKSLLVPLLICVLIFSSWQYLLPSRYDYSDESFYATNVGTTTVKNEYMPKWVKIIPTSYAYEKVFTDNGIIRNIQQKGTKLLFQIRSKKTVNVIVSYVYFPGWEALVDGKSVSISAHGTNGLIQFIVPPGEHAVLVVYKETFLHMLADAISLFCILLLTGLLVKRKYEK